MVQTQDSTVKCTVVASRWDVTKTPKRSCLVQYSEGIQDEGAEGIEGRRSGEIERNKQAHIKPVSFFFPPLPPSLSPLQQH